ncbi:energy-coupling factor ABC transporter substrate-binding protein [Clostridium sp. MSJ-4]|uniref:Cobalt transport protein CbiN n=1 Tax=Clostridium simiarum TaxID=2841506 RepID=A0ABS6EXW5_9CLOT|nr:energy-coupling factor ABC transporter substrate-binding protein [Clostridium simiarum]MBU5590570.1 energy-coupling factor ABC transporter substrate-binding protein [Clostridium simiarum]
MKKKTLAIVLLCFIIIAGALIIGKNGEFEGADAMAEEAIMEIDSSYEPWFSHIWEPPSGEIESFLFALQAAIGAGFIGYYIGRKTVCSEK